MCRTNDPLGREKIREPCRPRLDGTLKANFRRQLFGKSCARRPTKDPPAVDFALPEVVPGSRASPCRGIECRRLGSVVCSVPQNRATDPARVGCRSAADYSRSLRDRNQGPELIKLLRREKKGALGASKCRLFGCLGRCNAST